MRKEFAPRGGAKKFSPHRVDPLTEWAWCAEKQTLNQENCLSCEKWRGNLLVYPFTLTAVGINTALPGDL